MDKEKNQSSGKAKESTEHELLLQWGNRKRLRCVRVKDPDISGKFRGGVRMKITPQFLVTSSRNSEGKVNSDEKHKYPSPEKEEKCYAKREMEGLEGNGKGRVVDSNGNGGVEDRDSSGFVWPKLYITLSSKEKEEDFLAMKGCKPPQRPKKRAKIIQRSLLLVSPGAWLADMTEERYQVREKKGSKKRTRGLKSMGGGGGGGGSVETGSE